MVGGQYETFQTVAPIFEALAPENGYAHVGPMARYSLNFDQLSPLAREAAREAGLGPVCTNPFTSIIVRAVETLYAFEEAVRLVEKPHRFRTAHSPEGFGCLAAMKIS